MSDLLHIRCTCADPLHFLDFHLDDDGQDVEVTFVSTKNGYFWKRLLVAIPYIFGRDYLVRGDVLLTKAEAQQVAAFLGRVGA